MFKDMKIPVENNLDEIVVELNRLEYLADIRNENKLHSEWIYTHKDGSYDCMIGCHHHGKITTLAELKEM